MSAKPSEFRPVSGVFIGLANRGDFDGVEELFAEDCQIMAPGDDVWNGKKGVGKYCEHIKSKSYHKGSITPVKVMSLGEDYEFESGSYTTYDREEQVIDEGKCVFLQKRVNGKWKIFFNMFNSNKPSGGATAYGFQRK